MAKYVSGRQKNLKVGISSYSENLTSIQVIGNVGIGTTNATSKLYVVGDGYFTGVVTATNINVSSSSSFSQLYVSGITTLAANGGITTTGGDLYVGGDLYIADDLVFDEFTARNGNITGVATIATLNNTVGTITNLSGTNVNYTGVGTIATLNSTVTNATNLNGTNLNYTGVGTITTLGSTNGTITNLSGTIGTITTLGSTNGTITNLSGTIGTITTLRVVTGIITNINSSGVITATQFSTGSGTLGFTTNTISGPEEIIIDPLPVGVGTTSGVVRIKGDLYVDGTQFIVNSTTIELADFNVGIASTVGSNALLDGAGIGIGSANIRKTFTYASGSDALKSSENFDLASGKSYKINGTTVLSSSQLTVPNINATGVGTITTLNSTVATLTNLGGTNLNYSGVGTITNLSGTNVNYTGVGTIATLNSTVGTITNLGGTNVNYTGVGTIANLGGTNLNYTGVGTIAKLNSTVVTATNLGGTNVNYTGVGTITTLGSTNGTITNLSGTIGTITTLNSTVATLTNLGGTNVNYTGVGTITTLGSTNGTITNLSGTIGTITTLNSTVATLTNLGGTNVNYTGVGTIAALNSTVATLTNLGGTNVNYTGVGTITTLGSTNGTITNLSGTNVNYTGVGTITTLGSTNGTITNLSGTIGTITTLGSTNGTITNLGGTNVNYTGVGTITTLNSTVATLTNLGGTNLNYSGIGTITSLNSTVATLTNLGGTNVNYTGVGTITTLGSTNGTITNLSGTIGTITTLNSTNSTLTNINSSGIATLTRLGVNGLTTTSQLVVSGVSTLGVVTASQLFVSGVATATTFIGALTGIAASATQLVTPRTFQITGDVVASAISFDGTGNVSLAATIQPNSVGLGTDTTGDYVQSISGTANQITVTSGTGEGSTPTLSIPNQFTIPQDATVIRDLQVNRNLSVTGNITIGGTSATIFSQALNIYDPDIVLGYRTDGSGNDVANDNTANHGGIAIASTEGTPLVQLFIAGIETNPATYKKIMWFKAGTFAGLGTDAWLSNYAIGIGSTQFPAGTRLAAGAVQFTENDLSVIRNINASGIITATTGSITTINGTTANYSTGNIVTGVITNAQGTNLNYSGIGTVTNLVGTNINYTGVGTITTFNATTSTTTNANGTNLNFSGISTATTLRGTNINYSGVGTITTLNATTSTITNETGTNLNFSGVGTITTLNSTVATLTNLGGTNVNYTGVGTIITLNSTVATLTNLGGTNLNYSGVGTITTLNSTVATLTNLGGTNVNYTGVGTITTFNATTSTTTNANGTNLNFSGLSTATTLRGTNINYTGVGTITTFNATTSTITNETGTNLNFSGIATVGSLNIGATQVISSARQLQNIASLDATTTATIESAIANAPNTFTDLQVTGISTFTNGPVFIGSGTSTGTTSQPLQVTGGAYVSGNIGVGTTNPSEAITVLGKVQILQNSGSNNRIILRGQPGSLFRWNIDNNGSTNDFRIFREDDATAANGVVYLGISTSGTVSATIFSGQVNANVGIVTNVVGTNLNYSGIATVGSLNIGATQVISSARQLQNIASLDATTTATIESAIANAPNTFTDLQVTGISTFTNGPVFIGSGTSTGTLSQRLQVTGGGYVSGSVGIGTTSPTSTLHIAGDALIVGVSTANSFRARGGAPGGLGVNNNGYGFFGSGDNDSGMYSSADGQIEFYNNSSEAARITSNRNLLIGTTSETGTSSQPLQVSGGAYVSGSLGVGNTNPAEKLEVTGNYIKVKNSADVGAGLVIESGNATAVASQIFLRDRTFDKWTIRKNSSNDFDIYNYNTSSASLTIKPSGNVGINSTSPTSILDVLGDAKVSGVVTATTFIGQVNSGVGTFTTLNGTVATLTNLGGTNINYSGVGTIATLNSTVATLTNLGGTNVNYTGVGTIATLNGTVATLTNLGGTNVNYSGVGTIATLNSTVATLTNLGGTNLNFSGVGTITTLNVTNSSITNINSTGVITATQFTTGSGNLGFTTNTISGPSEIIIDPLPVGVGTTSGIVRIRGDLYVDGTQFVVNSTTVELADFNVGIASTVGTNALLDGAGIGIGSANIRKTFTYNNTANTLESSIGLGVTSGGSFKTGTSTVLTSTTLGSSVVNSSLTSVGTLGQLNVSGIATVDQLYTSNSGNGTNVRIGDDAWLGDINVANTTRLAGLQDNTQGFIVFGNSNSVALGRTGTGPLYYGGNFVVAGIITTANLNVSGITTSPTYDTVSTRVGSATSTTTSTAQIPIHTGLSTSLYRSIEYMVQGTQGTNYHSTKILVVHDGVTAYLTEYGTVYNAATVASYDVDISGGNLRLLATPSSASSTTFKVSFTSIVV